MLNIDIDTGGTMTDGLISGDESPYSVKVETTPHDVTVSLMNVLDAVRERQGHKSLRELLDHVELIRWSSTITSNVLAEKSGPKLGLLVSRGYEGDLYGSPDDAAKVIGELIDPENITGISGDATDTELRAAVKGLFDNGIRRINISLKGSFPDNTREMKIVNMISQQYPDHFLGSIPALPAGEISLRPDDMTRTVVSLINAYVHPSLASTLYRAEEIVRTEHEWQGNVLVGHINGGVARIAKTTAYDTIESGPLFGTHASAHHATEEGDDKVLALDVGGTTAKASLVDKGRVAELEEGHLFGIPLKTNLPQLRSIALGGGSVARAQNGHVVLGPDSMGAAPGPACYGLGGRNATVTDAFVVLGLVDPNDFLNGRRTLDVERAREAIDRRVASKLGLSVDDAAIAIRNAALDDVAQLARDTAAERGWNPADVSLYAFGGNGPLFVTGVADRLGASNGKVFRFGNVLSAYGSAISDIVHVYESAVTGDDPTTMARVSAKQLAEEAARDLRGEGFDATEATFEWQVRDTDGRWSYGEGDVESALAAAPSLIRLRASYPLPSFDYARQGTGSVVSNAKANRRTPPEILGNIKAYSYRDLTEARLDGPLLVDGGSFTWFIDSGWSISVDARGDATLTKA